MEVSKIQNRKYMGIHGKISQYIYKWWINWCLITLFLFSSGIQWNAWPYLLQCNLCGSLLLDIMYWSKIQAHGWSPVSKKDQNNNQSPKTQAQNKTETRQPAPPRKKNKTPTTRVFLSQVIVKQGETWGETAPSVRLNEMLPVARSCPIAAEQAGCKAQKIQG